MSVLAIPQDQLFDANPTLAAELRRSRRRPLLLRSTTNLARIEDLLLEVAAHALSFDHFCADDSSLEDRHAHFDMEIDGDFDGMS